jgi:glycosyltransferase involved in cell wall biosynthesis
VTNLNPNGEIFLHILIPAFGSSPYLNEALDSIIQIEEMAEVLVTVVDDASATSEIKEIVDRFSSYGIVYVRNLENLGLSANFEKSMNLSAGQFTLIMGSDDKVLPNVVSEIRQLDLNFPGHDFIQLKTRVIDKNGMPSLSSVDKIKQLITPSAARAGSINEGRLLSSLMVGDWAYFPAIAWRTSIRENLHWNSNYKNAIDLSLLARVASQGGSMGITKNCGFEYRRHSASISSQLANTTIRVSEELDVHYWVKENYRGRYRNQVRILASLAITIRLHALQSAIINFYGNPKGALKIAKIALSKLKSL